MLPEPRFVPQPPNEAIAPPQLSQEADGGGRALDPLDDAVRLHEVAVSLQAEGRLREALMPCQQALAVFETEATPDHPDVANILNTLAGIYEGLGDGAGAERLAQRSVAIMEGVRGSIELEVIRVQSLGTLAGISGKQWLFLHGAIEGLKATHVIGNR